jgi:hypothetical protein
VEALTSIKNDKRRLLFSIIILLLSALIAYSLYIRVRALMLGTSLWNDEALLAENIAGRSMGEMLKEPLTNYQTAPALYLVCVKALTLLFGASEAVLRLFSTLCFAALLPVQGLLLRKAFGVRMVYVFFSLAASATFLTYMRYSNELKPYMGDVLFCLLVLLLYWLYADGRLGAGVRGALLFGGACAAASLFSTPAVFFAAAAFLTDFLLGLKNRDKAAALRAVAGGAVVLLVFCLNYLLWLHSFAENPDMVLYWGDADFRIPLIDEHAVGVNVRLFKGLMEPLGGVAALAVVLAAGGVLVALARRSRVTLAACVAGALLLAASSIGKYPMSVRLWLFLYALVFVYAFVFLDALRLKAAAPPGRPALKNALTGAVCLLFGLALLAPNLSFPAYATGEEETLIPGNQANPLIEYVQDNIQDGELLYSYRSANPIVRYKNGYGTGRIGDVGEDNIFWGSGSLYDSALEPYDADMDMLAARGDGAYVLFYHAYEPLSADGRITYVKDGLRARGYLDRVMEVNHTPLYWFSPDLAHLKTAAALDVFDLTATPDAISGTLRVTNTGGTILESDGAGAVLVVLKRAGDPEGRVIAKLSEPLPQGASQDIWIDEQSPGAGEYQIELRSEGRFDFSEIGSAPFTLVTE